MIPGPVLTLGWGFTTMGAVPGFFTVYKIIDKGCIFVQGLLPYIISRPKA
jgi:hypothetical protein